MLNSSNTTGQPVASPCTDDCVLNTDKICTGCYRHIDEIAGWGRKPDDMKREILLNCERRKAELSIDN